MRRLPSIPSGLLPAVLLLGAAVPALATSAGDAGARVVVPLVAYDASLDTRLFVENHESIPLLAQIRYVGERGSSTPGEFACHPVGVGTGSFLLAPLAVTEFDLRGICSLRGPDDLGLVVLTVKPNGFSSRISARARVDVSSPRPGGASVLSQTFFVDGMSIGSLESTDSLHVATGLRELPLAAGVSRSVDCFLAAFYDGSGAGGVLARLSLKDAAGAPLGTDVLFTVRPLELVRLKDVFRLTGATPAALDGVRAEFALAGGGDTVAGYCWTDQVTAALGGHRTLTLASAQVTNPQDETRRRNLNVSSTPGVQFPGASFMIAPTERRVVHGLYVRHPDRVTCAVSSLDSLVLTAVSPDRAFTTTSGTGSMLDLGNVPHSQTGSGLDDLWGLEVSWGAAAAKVGPVAYTLSCQSGNGTSQADELFRN